MHCVPQGGACTDQSSAASVSLMRTQFTSEIVEVLCKIDIEKIANFHFSITATCNEAVKFNENSAQVMHCRILSATVSFGLADRQIERFFNSFER
jgi:hypothetical protein